jgi:hypothetical protein
MCCFSQPVEVVSDTNIFARSADEGRQFLVYSMSYGASVDLAMVLPLPVPPGSAEDAVSFINLQGYPGFFDDMRSGFPPIMIQSRGGGPMSKSAPRLRVHDVGDFEASFVPQIDDFGRLDERFRIAPEVWDHLPAYRDYGFAVFKLKASRSSGSAGSSPGLSGGSPKDGRPNPRTVHPMAFTFPRRNPDLLYFPTVHVHDRKVHHHAAFDHMLYCQADAAMEDDLQGWEKSRKPASTFIDIPRAEDIVEPDRRCWRLPLAGWRKNMDTLVGAGGAIP